MTAPNTTTPGLPASAGVLVLGEALVDCFDSGPQPGGAPFNVARSLAALGVPVLLITRIAASDEAGELVLSSARQFGLTDAGIQRDADHATGTVTVEQTGAAHRFIIHGDAAWDHLDLAQARSALANFNPALVYFGTLAQRSPTSRDTLRTLLQETRALRYLDLNLRDGPDNQRLAEGSLALADWLKVNDEELDQLLVWFVHPGLPAAAWGTPAHQQALSALVHKFQLQRLLVTRGANGYASFDVLGACEAEGAGIADVRLVDTVGAGDAFSAAAIAAHLTGLKSGAALELANRFAAAICAVRGPMPQHIEFFDSWRLMPGLTEVKK